MTGHEPTYQVKERSATDVTVLVTVPAETVKERIEGAYREYAREARIPGFRPGRAPRSLLDAHFGHDTFLDEAKKDLEREHLPKALDHLALKPVTPPALKPATLAESAPFSFEASFSVLPEFKLPAYRGVALSAKKAPAVSDEDVEAALAEIRSQFGTLEPKEGEIVQEGDVVHVKEKDEAWDTRAEASNEVTARLVGHKVGETVTIDLDLPEGRSIHASLEIVGLKQVRLPEVDDSLAKDAGRESLAALKEELRQGLEASRAREHEAEIERALLDRLLEQTEMPLPTALVDEIAGEEMERLKKNLAHPRSPLSFEDYLARKETSEEAVRDDYRQAVTRRIRRELVLQKVAEAERIAIGDPELEALATEEAKGDGEDPLRYIARLKAEDRWDGYRSYQENARVLRLLREAAAITEER